MRPSLACRALLLGLGWIVAVMTLTFPSKVARAEEVVVFSNCAEVRDGDKVILKPASDQRLRLVKVQRDWAQVSFQQSGQSRKGWIKLAHLLRMKKLTSDQTDRLNAAFADHQAAQRAQQSGDVATFLSLGEKALEGYRAALGAEHVQVAYLAGLLGATYRQRGDYDRAEPLYREAARIYKAVLGAKHQVYVVRLIHSGMLYLDMRELDKAEKVYHEAIEVVRETLGESNSIYGACLNNLSAIHRARGEFRLAVPLLRQSMELTSGLVGARHEDYVTCVHNLGRMCLDMGDFDQAMTHHARAVELRRELNGESDPRYIICLSDLARACMMDGQLPRAETLYLRAAEASRAARGEEDPEYATCLVQLADLRQSQRQFAQAEELLWQAIEIRQRALGERHPAHADGLVHLAKHLSRRGNYPRAGALYERALKILRREQGEQRPEYAAALVGFSTFVYLKTNDFTRAEALCQEALRIYQTVRPPEHPDCGEVRCALAMVYHLQDRYQEAEPLYRESLAILKHAVGDGHSLYGLALTNLATLLQHAGRVQEAVPLLQEASEILKRRAGESDQEYAVCLATWASAIADLGDAAQAEELLRQAAGIMRAAGGEKLPNYSLCLENLAAVQAAQGKWTEAAANTDIARRAVRWHAARVLPGLAEHEQGLYLGSSLLLRLSRALSMAAAHPDDSALAATTAEWSLNSKGIAHEALAARALLALQSTDPVVGATARRLLSVREELARLTILSAVEDDADRDLRLDALAGEELELSRQLGQAIGDADSSETWTGLAAIRARLPDDAVLIDIARFRRYNIASRDYGEERYTAWIIPADGLGEVRYVDLGVANGIDQSVAAVRSALAQTPALLAEQGEPAATAALAAPLGVLAELILEPLVESIGVARRLILCPDSNLWLAPWGALALNDGRFAIEEYQFQFVASGRDLLKDRATSGELSPPLIVADPEFSLARDQVAKIDKASGEARPDSIEDPDVRGATRMPQQHLPVDWARLPATMTEARTVAPFIERYSGAAPVLWTRAEAGEGPLKSVERPRVMLLSTHGFFLPDQEASSVARPGLAASDVTRGGLGAIDELKASVNPWENPLLRCGLVLAGANTRHERADDMEDDGILTGLEIVGLDLRGTELVVLSACETGLGDVRNGEGVAGLRQAFQLAGAEGVVATLWQIPDRDTAIIMGDFFASLAAGQSKAEALRNAQLARIAARRERNGAAHPLFWAAFTLTGH